jgi:hypothetical protein
MGNYRESLYTTIFDNFIEELNNSGTKLQPDIAPLFFSVLQKSLFSALDKSLLTSPPPDKENV